MLNPSIEEQKRIVEKLDIINKYQMDLKEQEDHKLTSLQKLKASILDSAFKGEL